MPLPSAALGRLGELAQLAPYEEDALRDREPRDRGEHVDRPLEQAPGGEAEADGDEHHALDPRAEADVAAQSDRLGLRARVRDEEGADTAANVAMRAIRSRRA